MVASQSAALKCHNPQHKESDGLSANVFRDCRQEPTVKQSIVTRTTCTISASEWEREVDDAPKEAPNRWAFKLMLRSELQYSHKTTGYILFGRRHRRKMKQTKQDDNLNS